VSDLPSESGTRELLARAAAGEPRAAEELLPILYDELRRLAANELAREAPGRTLQATALVHEAWLRLVGESDPGWNGRGHFFAAAARAMRRILVEEARRRGRSKRGGDRERVELSALQLPGREAGGYDLCVVAELLERLEARDPRKARLVELRWLAGLSAEDAAAALGISLATVEREWRFLKAWLQGELGGGQEDSRNA
jgi:RNA polymerase sigma factor (TIGR02999 family)